MFLKKINYILIFILWTTSLVSSLGSSKSSNSSFEKDCSLLLSDLKKLQGKQNNYKDFIGVNKLSTVEKDYDKLMAEYILLSGLNEVKSKKEAVAAQISREPEKVMEDQDFKDLAKSEIKKYVVVRKALKTLIDLQVDPASTESSKNEIPNYSLKEKMKSDCKTDAFKNDTVCKILENGLEDSKNSKDKKGLDTFFDAKLDNLLDGLQDAVEKATTPEERKNKLQEIYNFLPAENFDAIIEKDDFNKDDLVKIQKRYKDAGQKLSLSLFNTTYGDTNPYVDYFTKKKQKEVRSDHLSAVEDDLKKNYLVARLKNGLFHNKKEFTGEITINMIINEIGKDNRLKCDKSISIEQCIRDLNNNPDKLKIALDKIREKLDKKAETIRRYKNSEGYKKLNETKSFIYSYVQKNCMDKNKLKIISESTNCYADPKLTQPLKNEINLLLDDTGNIISRMEENQTTKSLYNLCDQRWFQRDLNLNVCKNKNVGIKVSAVHHSGYNVEPIELTEKQKSAKYLKKHYYADCDRKGVCSYTERRLNSSDYMLGGLKHVMPHFSSIGAEYNHNKMMSTQLYTGALMAKEQTHINRISYELTMRRWQNSAWGMYPFGINPMGIGSFQYGNQYAYNQNPSNRFFNF